MVSALISKVIMLVFGTLYPAYRSYKAIKNKDVREYVKWMMYWIIFALFITMETFADIFLSWLPLYYEIKIIFIIWLLSPATKGSSILYRKFVHPRLLKHEKAIDRYIDEAQKNSYAAMLNIGKKGMNIASENIVKVAATSQVQLFKTLKKYNSMQELSNLDNVDAPRGRIKRAVRQDGMSRPNSTPSFNFDPEDDVDYLEHQYTPNSLIQEDIQEYQPNNLINEDINEECEDEKGDSDPGGPPTVDFNEEMEFTSNTLPRMRKSRKTAKEAFPVEKRSTRSGKAAREMQYTKSVAF